MLYMEHLLSSEELEMLSQIRKYCELEFPKYFHLKESHQFPVKLFKGLAGLGTTAINTSEKYDGLDKSAVFTAEMMEIMATVDLGPAVFISVHLMVAKIIERFANDVIKDFYLPKLATGELLGAFALTEPSAGSDAASLKTTALFQDNSYILNGEKCYITSAGAADLYIVFARTDSNSIGKDGISAFIVDANSKGLTISSPEKKMGCELSPIASLNFSDVSVPKENILGELNKGYKIALSGLAAGRINIAACANGISNHAINLASSYLKERNQFGQPIANFQGLQFILADMRIKYESARCVVIEASRQLDSDKQRSNPNLYPSIAKCLATDNAMAITTDAVQLYGGAGYIKDYLVESLMRDAKMLQIVEGANQIQRILIAKATL
jgi:alkylation response protein AidB-like acyl-CoA dehydrogenase